MIPLELDDFTGKPCRSKSAYEFIPKKKARIDLEKAAVELSNIATIELRSKILILAKLENATISLFESGKLLIRNELDEKKARKIAQKIISILKKSVK